MRTQYNDLNEELLWGQNSPSHPLNGEQIRGNGKREIDNPDLNRDRNNTFDQDRNFDNDDEEEEDNDDFLDDGFDDEDDDDDDSLTDDDDADDDPQQTKRDQKRTGSDTNPE
jgi:AAA ATPase containing von Willebrand factor type A (vWA) domain